MKQKIGLFIGRFQPFHFGHIDALHQARKYGITEFFIGIGSSNKEHTAENPFTYDERKTMITKLLNSLHIKFKIYSIPDARGARGPKTSSTKTKSHSRTLMLRTMKKQEKK